MKTPDDQLLAAWLDGELSGEERTRFEAMMAADPALREEAQSMKSLGDLLRANVSFERELPHAGFFNSQLQERIAAEQRVEERAQAQTSSASLLSWFRAPWALAGVAAVLAAGLFFFKGDDIASQTQVLSLYVPNSGVQVKTFHSSDAAATVVMLDGLDTIPASHDIVGLNVGHSENDAEYATTTLFDEQGHVLLVMSKNARNQPIIFDKKG